MDPATVTENLLLVRCYIECWGVSYEQGVK